MSRETALKELKDIRQEIIEIHEAYDECQYYSKKVQNLQKRERKPIRTESFSKARKHSRTTQKSLFGRKPKHFEYDAPGILVTKVIHVIVQILIFVIMVLDGYSDWGVIENNPGNTLVLVVFHFSSLRL